MKFGCSFVPTSGPIRNLPPTTFATLSLSEGAEKIGFSHILIVVHYFRYYASYPASSHSCPV